MTLHLCRQAPVDGAIVGLLAVDGVFECYVLESEALAIPLGTYHVAITHSHRFDRDMPQLLDVPGRSGIRIHPGNTEHDTSGCLLVGRTRGIASVQDSRQAFDDLYAVLQSARTPITITIEETEAA